VSLSKRERIRGRSFALPGVSANTSSAFGAGHASLSRGPQESRIFGDVCYALPVAGCGTSGFRNSTENVESPDTESFAGEGHCPRKRSGCSEKGEGGEDLGHAGFQFPSKYFQNR